jgi:hypothetical protein
VVDLARLNQENTGKLLGYCRESTPFTRMLVFEYASNGTLYEHLHCKSIFLTRFTGNLIYYMLPQIISEHLYLLLQMEKDANFLGLGV